VSRPRVDLLAPPFSGHLHPLLGIGRRLARDVDVRVISTESADARIRASGLQAHSLLPGRDQEIWAIAEPPARSTPWLMLSQFRANLDLMAQFQRELRELYRHTPPDLVIADFTLPIAGYTALACGIPWWTSVPSPCVMETGDGPPAYLGGLMPRADLLGRARDAAGRALTRTFKRGVVFLLRDAVRKLGLPGPYRADGSEAAYSAECVLALGQPELEFATKWPAAVRFVGYPRYTPPGLGQTPDFAEGRAHVLVSIGTHQPHLKDQVAAATIAAARALPQVEFHFTDGRSTVMHHTREGNFQRLGFVHYDLIPRYDLIVHHAGTGVMYHTLAAGIPAVVRPLDFDQFDYATRLCAAGLAMRLRSLDDLAATVERALRDDSSAEVRRRFRELIASASPEERVSAMVGEYLGPASWTVKNS
jgi:UDP:flavonoid glycosyltransferase YjiC (YdhE family)